MWQIHAQGVCVLIIHKHQKSPRKRKKCWFTTDPHTHDIDTLMLLFVMWLMMVFLFLTCCSFLQLLTINKKHNNYLLYFLRYRSMFECALLKTTTIRLYMFVSFCFERERKISADYFWKKNSESEMKTEIRFLFVCSNRHTRRYVVVFSS